MKVRPLSKNYFLTKVAKLDFTYYLWLIAVLKPRIKPQLAVASNRFFLTFLSSFVVSRKIGFRCCYFEVFSHNFCVNVFLLKGKPFVETFQLVRTFL